MALDFDEDRLTRLWVGGAIAAVVALVAGSLVFTREVYAGFVWRYFWGPVYADANGATCTAWAGGQRLLFDSSVACSRAAGPYAEPGYTLVSEIGYAATLLFALIGVVILLRTLDIGKDPKLFFALLPFMFLGGALRVVEDVNDAAMRAAGVEPAINYPVNALIISPVIYFTMFAFTLLAVLVAVRIAREGYVDGGYERPLAVIGAGALALVVLYLLGMAVTTEYVYFLPQFSIATLGIASVVAYATWWGVREYAPAIASGTGTIGLVVVWGHAVDGAANVLGLDWGLELGYPYGDLGSKHPVNEFIVTTTREVLPEAVTHVTGSAWPFLVLKVAVALFVVSLFDEQLMDESPRYSVLMLVAVLAVGLGPGTRDFLRATFGV